MDSASLVGEGGAEVICNKLLGKADAESGDHPGRSKGRVSARASKPLPHLPALRAFLLLQTKQETQDSPTPPRPAYQTALCTEQHHQLGVQKLSKDPPNLKSEGKTSWN